MRISADDARDLATGLLCRHGVPAQNAALQADLLVEAEVRGLPSHGLQRLQRLIARIERGLAAPAATGAVDVTRPGFLSVDGQHGLGPVVMMATLERLADTALAQGIAVAGIRNANHIGMLAYYAEAATARGLIGIVLSTSEALVHPFGGTEAMLGTNPIAIGIPSADGPFILDMATSEVSMGKIHHHAADGRAIPEGWAVDARGRPTTDAETAKSGAIAPFGGPKGYGLGLAFELLVAVLAGSDMAPDVRGTLDDTDVANKGDVLFLIDPATRSTKGAALAAYLDRLRHSRPLDPARPVAVPGDGMRRRRAAALAAGIDLPETLHSTLTALAATGRHHGETTR